ncbi:MAG: 50S ribosomal protein L6 [Thermoanaerobaculia bacterium]|jgi:large subunit ribosomal protein L6|nr:MAG: 50S ribosomal protein L6 [Thermoanaerobaculia bacterium]MBZ0101330.1 50S ribosomal protein L6 [Thermoanaerobaculia bacterium]
MSRVGRSPIEVPKDVKVQVVGEVFVAEGPKGRVDQKLIAGFPVKIDGSVVSVERPSDAGPDRAKHGLLRALLANAVQGAAQGFTRSLDIVGVGYKAEIRGEDIHFALGYSHPVVYRIPKGMKVDLDPKANRLTFSSADRQLLGQVCAEIRRLRSPDPYKGKGIKFSDEVIRRKVGKAGAK